MGRTVSFERVLSISVFIHVLADFPFFQIISDYPITCFSWSYSGETTTNLESSTSTRPSTLFLFFYVTKPLLCGSNFLQNAQRNLISIVIFPAFSLLIIFVFLKFILNNVDSNASFQASSLLSRPSN